MQLKCNVSLSFNVSGLFKALLITGHSFYDLCLIRIFGSPGVLSKLNEAASLCLATVRLRKRITSVPNERSRT